MIPDDFGVLPNGALYELFGRSNDTREGMVRVEVGVHADGLAIICPVFVPVESWAVAVGTGPVLTELVAAPAFRRAVRAYREARLA